MNRNTVTWRGCVLSCIPGDGDGHIVALDGFGPGQNIVAVQERAAGGQRIGRAVRAGKAPTAEVWTDAPSKGLRLAASMDADAVESPLAWSDLGWGDLELAMFAVPAAAALPLDEVSATHGVFSAMRLGWVVADPTVYSAVPEVYDGDPASSHSVPWTNPGLSLPAVGLGGRAWVVELTASSTVVGPVISRPAVAGWRFQGVRYTGLTMAPGQVLRIDHERHAWLDGVPVTGRARSGASIVPDWPVFPPGVETSLDLGATSGTFSAHVELRGTW